MRSLPEFLSAYGVSHKNTLNQYIHFVCVPLIFFSIFAMLWALPVGQWLSLDGAAAYWVNGATIAAVLTGLVYLKLGLGAFVLMAFWYGLSLLGIFALEALQLHLVWTGLAIFVLSWIGQFYGHKVEGAKPSFFEDLVFLLIGPIFVSVEMAAKVGLPVPYAMDNHS
ncbi:conserved hypothetical protein [gamma proteobacterium HTCC5015]|nr:conserved hypothetical protein [gamma proteobacterium HTCC5015]